MFLVQRIFCVLQVYDNQIKGVVKIYKYIYIRAIAAGAVFSQPNHKEIIDQCSEEGWRFVTAIPAAINGLGVIKEFDLVFEKEV